MPAGFEYLQLNSVALGRAWWANEVRSLWSQQSAQSAMTFSVSLLSTPCLHWATAQADLSGVARDYHRGKMWDPMAEVHVGFRINWNDFCFAMNIIQTVFVLYLTPKISLNQKLLDEALDSGIEFLLEKLWLLQILFGCWGISFTHTCLCTCTFTIMCMWAHMNNKSRHTLRVILLLRG